MNIQKSNVFLGSVFVCNVFQKCDSRKDYFSLKNYFEGRLVQTNVLFLKIGRYYVPVNEITGPHDLNKLIRACKSGYDKRFLTRTPHGVGQKFLDRNNLPVKYFCDEGETSLSVIWRIQKELQEQHNKETEI